MSLRVLFATAELTPIAKVGGLADVAGALPPVLATLGVDVRVVLPKYDVIDDATYHSRLVASNIPVTLGAETQYVNIYSTTIPNTNVIVYLIDNEKYLGRNGIYFSKTAFVDSISEVHRFVFFSKAILEIFGGIRWTPDIIHCQDWHVGILPTLLKLKQRSEPSVQSIKTLFTIHNLANQGLWNKAEVLDFLGLKEAELPLPLESGDINLIQQGIRSSDLLNAVSQTYAQEILTPEYGEKLENDIQKRRTVLFGIVNGIDQDRFNPATDPDIAVHYTSETIEKKADNKKALQEKVGLAVNPETLVFGLVSRLTNQKGIELIAEAVPKIVELGAQLIVLGQGATEYETMLQEVQKKYPKHVSVTIGFDASLAQAIYAGSDIFLMPSRFEPCGLGQLIAMRYGTVPIARATGGLKDTVEDYNPASGTGDGFVFSEYSTAALIQSIERATDVYRHNPDAWKSLIRTALAHDSTWTTAAKEYVQLYKKLVQ
ncbi:MAG: glycogen/starch synthase [Patescibacteria group bacterium]